MRPPSFDTCTDDTQPAILSFAHIRLVPAKRSSDCNVPIGMYIDQSSESETNKIG